ncbi:MAG: PHP domain-containing protein [Candidatus Lokiarchaeota archaeon]|nr:PHP domain-containing protein [Candidatus Lokiarchaeota archaeon]
MIDLHLHSNCSDGADEPTALIDIALDLNIKAIALTDHDTIDGIEAFMKYGELKDLIVLPGIEISIKHEPRREIEDVHIVGLNIDWKSHLITKTLEEQMKGRLDQKKAICKRLRDELGYDIRFDEVQEVAGSNSVGRPHIVQIMEKNNPDIIRGKTRNELFKMISLGGIAYVDRSFELNLEESIELIISCGGIPILAHPGIYEVNNRKKFVQMCVKAGIEGIEVEYPYSKNRPFYDTEKAAWADKVLPKYYGELADKLGLIKSGGSDYHGNKKDIKIGEVNVPDDYLKKLI